MLLNESGLVAAAFSRRERVVVLHFWECVKMGIYLIITYMSSSRYSLY